MKTNIIFLLYLIPGLPLYSVTPFSIIKSVIYSCGSHGAQEIGRTTKANDSNVIPEVLQDDKLDTTLQNMLTEKYPELIFVKQNGGNITAHRNIIYVGKDWEKTLTSEEHRQRFMPFFEEGVRYYLQKNANGFYDKKLVGTVSSDVAIGVACWKKFPRMQNSLQGRLKIAGLTCVLGTVATTAITRSYHTWYDFVSYKPETEQSQFSKRIKKESKKTQHS